MSTDDCNCPPCPPAGSPAWMGTFADLMSLLMCFFVLLLSFSEMDALKFKRLAGSMAQAFGVQAEVKAYEIPKGTSIIAQEFSPGRPEPTPINEIYQKTDQVTQESLDVECAEAYDVEQGEEGKEAGAQLQIVETDVGQQKLADQVKQLIDETQEDARDLAKALKSQIARGEVEIETAGRQIVIRIREKGSFGSGSARLSRAYFPVIQEMSRVLASKQGRVMVHGHTDNIPIATRKFRSNWELSTARAVSVAHELFTSGELDPSRVQVSGFAATKPLAKNDSVSGRARNRRVEIVIHQGLDEETKQDLEALKKESPELYQELQLDPSTQFDLSKGDIF